LTDDPGVDTYARWSADGSQLAYLHADQSGQAIYSISLAGGEPRLLVRTGGWFAGHGWSPDGRNLVYAEGAEPTAPAQLFLLDLETGVGRPLLPAPPAGQGDVGPVYSPDGESIAFSRIDAGGLDEIHVIPAGGGEVRQITHGALHTKGMDWSRDGRSLIYSAVSSSNYSLWRVDVRDGSVTGLPTRGEWVHFPTVARHADRLVYQDIRFDKRIWQVRRSDNPDVGLTTGPLTSSTRWESQGTYSSDGSRVAFLSARTGNPELWTAASDGSRPLQLTRFEGLNVGNPAWSPDGERIAFHANPNGFTDLYSVSADGSPPLLLSCGEHNHLMSSWSRDGEWIYYGCDRTGWWEIWKLRPGGSEEDAEQVTPDGGIVGYESVDGEALYFTKPGAAGLWRLSLSGDGAEPEIFFGGLPAQGDWENWGLFDGGAAFVLHDREGPILCVLDFGGGGLQSITRVPSIASPSLGVSRDGLSILYARVEGRVSDLMLVEGFR
jgi:Tol biopolymer transport system component